MTLSLAWTWWQEKASQKCPGMSYLGPSDKSHRFFSGMRRREVVEYVSKECCLTARKVSYLIWD